MDINSENKDSKGFTLIELIIVVGIVAILSIGVLTVLNPFAQFQKAADARRKTDLSQVQRALEVYYQDNGHYPPNATNSNCVFEIQGNNGDGNDCIEWGGTWQPYMNVVPKDPGYPNYTYAYYVTPDGQSYYIYASLNRGTLDPQACNKGNACNSILNGVVPVGQNTCGGICNFGVTSPNVSP